MPESHRHYQQGWDPDYFHGRRQPLALPPVSMWTSCCESRQFSEQAYPSLSGGFYRLGKTYSHGRLEAACNRALQGEACAYRIINNILANNLDQQNLPG